MSESNPYVNGPGSAGNPGPPGGLGGPWGPPTGQPPGYGYPGARPAPGAPLVPPGPNYPQEVPGYGYPGEVPGYGYPGAPDGPGPQGPTALAGGSPLVSIGDITVLNTGTIVTPTGTLPLRGAVWNAMDLSRTEEKIPAHAIVLAIVFFVFCFLGLLFLLMKEKSTTGFIQITVTSGGKHHSTMVPATGPMTFSHVMGQIGYARSISV